MQTKQMCHLPDVYGSFYSTGVQQWQENAADGFADDKRILRVLRTLKAWIWWSSMQYSLEW